MASRPQPWCSLGHAGFTSRAVVFGIIGWSLVQSAWFADAGDIKTLGGAVSSLAEQGILYTLTAVGLVLFGLFSLLMARYRIVPDLDGADMRPSWR